MTTPQIDASWNYGDPTGTRQVFADLADENSDAPLAWHLELQTQIARTHSLVGEFDEAHKILDGVEPELTRAMSRAGVRYNLERGRAFNSAGRKEEARPLFVEAFDIAKEASEDFLAVDAAHMVAIVDAGKEEANTWAAKGLELARASQDKKARGWVGPITNNLGWDAFDAKNYEEALGYFEESQKSFIEREEPARARIARWSMARVWRAQGKLDEALNAQLQMLKEHEEAGTNDAYVHEELAELYLLRGEAAEAKPHFARAFELLSEDQWFVKNEAKRLARMKELSE